MWLDFTILCHFKFVTTYSVCLCLCFFSESQEDPFRMKNSLNFIIVCTTLIVLAHSLPQGLELGDSVESEIETSSVELSSTTTTTARPFQPLRPYRPLASMIHSTLQSIESIVVSASILATTVLDSLNPNARLNRIINKSNETRIS